MPALNAGTYIVQAVDSVLAQEEPGVELVVVDGGSTDATLPLLEAYGSRLRVVRLQGNQAAAIQHGVHNTGGDVIAILNADDAYLPGAFARVRDAFIADPNAGVVYGHGLMADASGAIVGRYPTEPFSPERLLEHCIICQPAAFIRREALEAAGGVSAHNRLTWDYELWLKIARNTRFAALGDDLAISRDHPGNKSHANRRAVMLESMRVLRRVAGYVPYSWAFAFASLVANGDVARPGGRRFLSVPLSLAVGVYFNPLRAGRFVRDWLSHRSIGRRLRVF